MAKKETQGLNKALYVRINSKKFKESGEIVVTGYPMDAEQIASVTGIAPKGNYEMVMSERRLQLLETFFGARGKVVAYLLRKRDNNNICFGTNDEIMKGAKVSHGTMQKVLKELEELGFIVNEMLCIMVDPEYGTKGSRSRMAYLKKKFNEMSESKKKFRCKGEEADIDAD